MAGNAYKSCCVTSGFTYKGKTCIAVEFCASSFELTWSRTDGNGGLVLMWEELWRQVPYMCLEFRAMMLMRLNSECMSGQGEFQGTVTVGY